MRIFLENLQVSGHHGVYDYERREGRQFRIDLSVDVDDWTTSDDPGEILDYRKLASIVEEVLLEGPARNLIETIAWDIANRTFERHERVNGLQIAVRKQATGVAGDPEWVGVSAALDRTRWSSKRGGA